MFRNKNNSTVAYAVRIQIMFDTYKRDGGFSKNICQQLFKEHRKCIKSTIFYWVSKGKYFSAFKVIFRCVQLKVFSLVK